MGIRIAQLRAVPDKGDLDANHATLTAILDEVARENVDVVVTPECFLDGYVATEEGVDAHALREYAIDSRDNPYTPGVAAWARENGAWVVYGCSRLSPDGVCNSALVFDRAGTLAGTYDKTHCQTHDSKYVPGDRIATFEADFGPFGVLICADRRWPETVRTLALGGARVIFNPTYGMHDERNAHMMRTRSYESEVFIAFTHPRQSLLTDPTGRIVCNDADATRRYAVTEIDLSLVDDVRGRASAHLKDRRPELYSR